MRDGNNYKMQQLVASLDLNGHLSQRTLTEGAERAWGTMVISGSNWFWTELLLTDLQV